MATVTTQSPDLTRGGAYVGLQHYVVPLTDVSNGELVSPGMDGITHVAWEPDDSGDIVIVTVVSTTSIGLTATGGPHTGTLHVWARA